MRNSRKLRGFVASSLALGGALALAQPAVAQDHDVQELVVTGVGGAPRTLNESPTPIDSFSAADRE